MRKNMFLKLIVCIIFIIVLSNFLCTSESYALGNIFSKGKDFLKNGESIDSKINTSVLQETSNTIYNTLLAIAIMVAIVVSMVLGIQFIAASADEKAKVKEALMPFVVGCIVVFGSFTIWKLAVNIGNKTESMTGVPSYNNQYLEEITSQILTGQISVGSLSKNELKALYNYYGISQTISILVNRNSGDFNEAIREFSTIEFTPDIPAFEVYTECKNRGMLVYGNLE